MCVGVGVGVGVYLCVCLCVCKWKIVCHLLRIMCAGCNGIIAFVLNHVMYMNAIPLNAVLHEIISHAQIWYSKIASDDMLLLLVKWHAIN